MSFDVESMIERFTTIYGAPSTHNVPDLLDEYRDAMRGFDPAILKAGTDYAIRNNPRPFWPTIGEVYAACNREVERDHAAWKRTQITPREPIPPPLTDEERARAKQMMAEFNKAMAAMNWSSDVDPDESRRAGFRRCQRDEFEAMRSSSPNRFHYRRGGARP